MAERLRLTDPLMGLSPDNPAAIRSREPEPEPRWRSTAALLRGISVASVALLAAVAFGRVDLVVIVLPLAIGTAVALSARPNTVPQARLRLTEGSIIEGAEAVAEITVANDEPVPILATISTEAGAWMRLRHGFGRFAEPLAPAEVTTVHLEGTTTRWGPRRLGPVTIGAIACDGLLVADARVLPGVTVQVLPMYAEFDSSEALPRAAGVAGIHRSRRLGDGGELAEVRPFGPGDRLRRIDWRVSLRNRELYVNSTLSERDADVLIILDVLHEAGVSGGLGGADSVLDATVRAAAAICDHYAHQGDRVTMIEFGPRVRRMRAGSGRRHHLAALHWLSQTGVLAGGVSPSPRMFVRQIGRSDALHVMLTPLIDYDSVNLVALLARSGRSLIAVDTLPSGTGPEHRGVWTPAAERIWRIDRDNTIGRLRETGVPVAPWRGPGSLDLMLRDVARMAASPRMVR